MVFFIALAVLGTRVVWDEFRFEETSPGIGVPKWWYTIWLPLLSVAIVAARGSALFSAGGREGAPSACHDRHRCSSRCSSR